MYTSSDSFIWDQDFGAYDYSRYDDLLNRIIQTIVARQWLNVFYTSRSEAEPKEYTIFPYRLFSFHGSMYLVAYLPKHDSTISLVLQRIQSVFEVKISGRNAPPFNLEDYRNNRFGIFGGTIETVQLRIDPAYVMYFRNRMWHPSQVLKTQSDGSILLTMQVPLSPELITWIMGWHQAIKVLSPETLVVEIVAKANSILGMYQQE